MTEITTANGLNPDDIQRFFEFLDWKNEVFNYALFDETTKKPLPGCGILFGTYIDILTAIGSIASPFSLHVTLNRTNLNGRRNKDIESPRVLCVDLDRVMTSDDILSVVRLYQPQLVVESSPGKYHLYWKLSPKVTLEEWQDMQSGLAQLLEADPQLSSLTHLIRVPGVPRVCKDGTDFTPRIVYQVGETLEYDRNALDSLIPDLSKNISAAKELKQTKRKDINNKFKAGEIKGLDELALEENRNSTLYSVVRNAVFTCEEIEAAEDQLRHLALNVALSFNQRLSKNPKGMLPMEEIEATAESAATAAIEARAKRAERRAAKVEKVKEIQEIAGIVGMNGDCKKFEYDFHTHELRVTLYSEEAAAERVLQRFGESLINASGVLYAFNEHELVWEPQTSSDSKVLRDMVKRTINDIISEEQFALVFANTKDGIDPEKLHREICKWKTASKNNSIVSIIKAELRVRKDSLFLFDSNPYLFLCANGVVDLRNGELRAAEPLDYLMKRSRVTFDREAKCPWWIEFLRQVFRDNRDPLAVIAFLQEVFGYSLSGSIKEQKIFIHFGAGANGKSRILYALAALLGEYGGRLQPDSLGTKKSSMGKALERIAAKAEGKRGILIDDLDTGMEWNEGLVKSLTEGVVVSRRLFEEERDIPNRSKVHIGCNEIPKVEQSSHAVYRRLAILEYSRRFEVSAAKHEEITQGIDGELSGILNWAMEGLQRIESRQEKTILYPSEVNYAVEEYEENNSPLENELLNIVSVIKNGPQNDDDWVPLKEIVLFLKENASPAQRNAKSILTMSESEIGVLLGRVGAEKRRIRLNGEKQRQYRVKLLKEKAADLKFS